VKGFKDFVLRGNVIDLAIAVVIGAAFTAVVNAVVTNLFNPLLGALFNAKSLDDVAVVKVGTATLQFGSILAAVIQFILYAIVIYFVFVLPIMSYKKRAEARQAQNAPAEPPALTELEVLTQIRDLLDSNAAPSSSGKHAPAE
jgi:large conductance mechanosensitive channel